MDMLPSPETLFVGSLTLFLVLQGIKKLIIEPLVGSLPEAVTASIVVLLAVGLTFLKAAYDASLGDPFDVLMKGLIIGLAAMGWHGVKKVAETLTTKSDEA